MNLRVLLLVAGIAMPVTAIAETLQLTLTWDAQELATNYRVRSKLDSGSWRPETKVTPARHVERVGLSHGQKITYAVRACNSSGCSAWSSSVSYTHRLPKPGKPVNLSIVRG